MVKKGRHRRYEEARRFQRSSTFNLEEFDLDAPDPFALPETNYDDDADNGDESDADGDDKYAELARRYADFDEGADASAGDDNVNADDEQAS